jgi:hypothetical protein
MNSFRAGDVAGAVLVIAKKLIIDCAGCTILDASLSVTLPPYSARIGTLRISTIESAR